MIQDLNKDIATIEYNHLNLPIKVIFNTSGYQNREVSYLYDATGVKLEKIVNTGTFSDGSSAGLEMITHTQYDGGFIYKYTGTSTPELTFFSHPEGYIEPDNQGNYDYVYQYKDHLGNIRLSYKNVGTSTNPVLDIIEEKNYYPFGLQHKGYNNTTSGNVNSVASKFGFGGKELNDELELNWHDFGARNYDASLGRWMNLDPLAEKYMPYSIYAYVGNNPIFRFDPNGMEWDDEKSERVSEKMQKKLHRKNQRLEKRNSRLSKRISKAESKGKTDKVDRLNAKKTDNEGRVAVNENTIQTLQDIGKIEGVKFAFSNNVTTEQKSNTETISRTTFSRNNEGVYLINNNGSLGNRAHEVTHAGQVLSGEVSLEPGSTIPTLAPRVRFIDLEVAGYKARYAVDGSVGFKVEGIHDPQFIIKLSKYLNSNRKSN